MNASRPSSASWWTRLSPHLLLFVVACFWFSLYTYPSILTPYLDELQSTYSFSGVVVGSYGFTQMLLRLPAGVFSDKLRKKKVFVSIGLLCSFLSALGFTMTQELWLILILRALAGVAAAMWVQMSTLYISYYPAEDNMKAMGRINFANTSATMVATLFGGLLAKRFGWSAAFVLAAAVAALGLFASLFIQDEAPDDSLGAARQDVRIRDAFLIGSEPLLLITSILALLSQLVAFATAQGFVPVFAKSLGAQTDQIALMATLATLPRAVASLLGGQLASGKRFTASRLIAFGFLINGAMILLLPLIQSFPLLVLTQMACGFGAGLQMTLLMGLCTRNIPASKKASAMGFFQAVYGIGMVLGPVIVGGMSDVLSLNSAFILIGSISLLALPLMHRYRMEASQG